jgi:hypothetical protein
MTIHSRSAFCNSVWDILSFFLLSKYCSIGWGEKSGDENI